jgi:transposase, IS5 family
VLAAALVGLLPSLAIAGERYRGPGMMWDGGMFHMFFGFLRALHNPRFCDSMRCAAAGCGRIGMRRELGQLSLADGLVEGGAGRNRQLEKIAALVDWPAFERLLGGIYAAPVGRPSYGPLVLLRCLLLQQWYRLSDPGLEEALSDRLSFRRFVGLALADPVPDHSTLSRFRSELVRRGLAERLLAELNRQLDAKGLMVKTGTLIDASLVEADCRGPRKGEPRERRSDPDASWNAMPETPLFGYKAHLAVDRGSGLVRQAILTPANVSDKAAFLALVQGDEQAVYADKGYDGWWYRAELAERGIADGIMAGSYWRRPLDAASHARNRAIGKIRAPVERSFAILKRWYGYRRVRYRNLVRNTLQLQLLALALNLRRALALSA